jgi:hypothetical protein
VNHRERNSAILTLLLLVNVFAVTDLVLGLVFIPQNFNHFRVRDTRFYHGLKKNVSANAVWAAFFYRFYTNNLAFRDASVREVDLTSDKKRILILGDSHSEGVGVDYRFTFAGRLQNLGVKHGIEILNTSAVSYSPKIHYLKAGHLLNKINLKVDEIWAVIDISDLQNEIAYQSFSPEEKKHIEKITGKCIHFLRNHSFTFFSVVSLKEKKENERFSNALLGLKIGPESSPNMTTIELYKDFFRSFKNEELLKYPGFHGVSEWIYNTELREMADQSLGLGFENISKLNQLCAEHQIKLRLSVHPLQTQVLKGDITDYYVNSWRKFCQQENIDFINLYPVFINEENLLWITQACYIERDNHFSETGHERVAQYFSKYLNKLK